MGLCNQESENNKCEQPQCKPEPCNPKSCNNKYVQPCRPKPCKPLSTLSRVDGLMAGNTVYNSSYDNFICGPRQKPIIRNDHIIMAGEFDGTTINKMSFPVHCSSKAKKIVPRDHCLGGTGPMANNTTQLHDYYIPCGDRRQKIVPPSSLRKFDDCPMASMTTNNCSYRPVCADRATSFKPYQCYATPKVQMDMNTVQRSSYKSNCPQEKIKTPWATRMAFCKPKEQVENCTIYNQSFQEPGHYVPVNGGVCSTQQACLGVPRTCCPVGCLATKVEDKVKSDQIKAHYY